MTQTVNVPGIGQLNFPDGMSQQEMAAAIQRNFPQIHNQGGNPDNQSFASLAAQVKHDADTGQGWKANPIVALGEAALNMGSSLVAKPVSDIAGLAAVGKELISPSDGDPAAFKQEVQNALTYEPKTAAGKIVAEYNPLTLAAKGIGKVADAAGNAIAGDNAADTARGAAGNFVRESINQGAQIGAAKAISALRRPAPLSASEPTTISAPAALDTTADAAAPEASATVSATDAPAAPANTADTDVPLYTIEKRATGAPVSDADQLAREQTLQRIGLSQVRESAIVGDPFQAAVEAQTARIPDEPAGAAARDIFNAERSALQNHAQKIVADTGGSFGLDEASNDARGQVIAAPFDGLRQHFDNVINQLYQAADQRSGGMPIASLDGLNDLLNTDSTFAGKAENGSLRNGIRSYLREQGLMDKDGNLSDVTPQQAEGIKQYINSQWSPETSGLAGKIKSTIDDDVFKSAGEDVYEAARNMYRMKKATLDNPSGIAKLLDYDPQTPINRATPFEKIPDKLTRLPAAQFGHVIDVLQKVLDPQYQTPEPLVLQAYDALNEIKGHMANQLLEIGAKNKEQWNAAGVTQYLKNNSAKLRMLFNKDEMTPIRDLNDAGQILSVDKDIAGAEAQANANLKRGFFPTLVKRTLPGVGGLTGSLSGPVGAAIGSTAGNVIGEGIAARLSGYPALRRFNQGIVNLDQRNAIRPPSAIETPTSPADTTLLEQLTSLKNATAAQILQEGMLAAQGAGIIAGAANAPQNKMKGVQP